MSRRIQIFDTTLRDGEQAPGIALQPQETAEIVAAGLRRRALGASTREFTACLLAGFQLAPPDAEFLPEQS